jgi:hypothetical protein
MTREEMALLDAARATLERAREVRVVFKAAWHQMDDLDGDAEAALKQVLHDAFRGWAEGQGLTVSGPENGAQVFAGKAYEITSFSRLGDPAGMFP